MPTRAGSTPAALLHAITELEPPPMPVRAVAADPALAGSPAAIAEARRTAIKALETRTRVLGEENAALRATLERQQGEFAAALEALRKQLARR